MMVFFLVWRVFVMEIYWCSFEGSLDNLRYELKNNWENHKLVNKNFQRNFLKLHSKTNISARGDSQSENHNS